MEDVEKLKYVLSLEPLRNEEYYSYFFLILMFIN
jgi:hypothetical protein